MYSSTHNNIQIKPTPTLRARAAAKLKLMQLGLSGRDPFAEYQFAPAAYITQKLGWSPWSGTEQAPGQQQILDAYTLAVRQQLERQNSEAGRPYDATIWQPGQVIQNRIRTEAGHTVGKTKILSGIVNHFIDCFKPSIIYTFAPTWEQVKKLLWKEIKTDRRNKGLPGRLLENCELIIADNHFAQGKATNDANGAGTERVQGQHGEFLMFILDEAEGVADFVYDAIDSMASGGIVIVLMMANPKTSTSTFHRQAAFSNVRSLRMSCLQHPNVIEGREIVPGAVRRDYVLDMIEKHCQIAHVHNTDAHTFELPWQPGTIYVPNNEFLFRVLGIAPTNSSSNTFVPSGRYLAAVARGRAPAGRTDLFWRARIGVDVARFGDDLGTVYVNTNGRMWRAAQLDGQDTFSYVKAIKAAALALPADVYSLHIRVDGTGGFGSGIIDRLRIDPDLRRRFRDFQVIEVQFGGSASKPAEYADLVTEMYAMTAEVLKDIALVNPPAALESDLTERRYGYEARGQLEIKKLESKDTGFRKRVRRSPDDGDGCVLAGSHDLCFTALARGGSQQQNWMDS